jgi:transcriptional regulator with XRE-family HTH domain
MESANIIKKIKEIRIEKKILIEDIALKLSISANAYRKIEMNYTKLTVERLYQISEILKCTVADILEIKPNNEYKQEVKDTATGIAHQELKDNAIAHVENLYQDNKEKFEKIELLYESRIKDKDQIIAIKDTRINELEKLLNL